MIIIRKNGRLNAAAAGLERGIGNGLQVGLQAAQGDRQQQHLDLVKADAARAADAYQRQVEQENAAQEAVGALGGADSPVPQGQQGPPAPGGSPHDDIIKKVGQFASRMDPKLAPTFIKMAQEQHRKFVFDQARQQMTDELATLTKDSTLWADTPDGGRQESKQYQDTLAKITEGLGNEQLDPRSFQSMIDGLKVANANARTDAESKKNFLATLDEPIGAASAGQAGVDGQPVGPPTAQSAMAKFQQHHDLTLMRHSAEHSYAALSKDPKMMQEFLTRHSEAAQGNTRVKTGPGENDYELVPYEQAPLVRQMVQESAQLKRKTAQETDQLKAKNQWLQNQLDRQKLNTPDKTGAEIGKLNAETDAASALADYRRRGPAAGGKPMTQAEAMDMATKQLSGGDKPATVTEIRTRARQLIRGLDYSDPNGGAAQQPAAQPLPPQSKGQFGFDPNNPEDVQTLQQLRMLHPEMSNEELLRDR